MNRKEQGEVRSPLQDLKGGACRWRILMLGKPSASARRPGGLKKVSSGRWDTVWGGASGQYTCSERGDGTRPGRL